MRLTLTLLAALLAGCSQTTPPTPEPRPEAHAAQGAAQKAAPAAAASQAEVGKPAPAFSLKDYDGKSYSLADLRGKTVVLEWFNPDCPFVKASHGKGSLKDLAKRMAARGVVWLAINSSAPGKQGHGPERVAEGKKAFGMEHPVLADESGEVGRRYGAVKTPHMYVIDGQGVLVYKGAIDNSPDGEGGSPTGGKLINHVEVALDELAAGKPVTTRETQAYGCSVKYGG